MNTQTLNQQTFDSTINDASTPVLVDFWAEGCGPCRMLSPILEELAAEHAPQSGGYFRAGHCAVIYFHFNRLPKKRQQHSNLNIHMKLQNKIAVITGGNSGIGLATTKELVADGGMSQF